MLRTMEDLLGMKPLGLNDGLQGPMSEVFTRDFKEWKYTPVVPQVLRTTKLPLPPRTADDELPASKLPEAGPPHDAAYWASKMRGFDFKRSDHLDTGRFNRVLWEGMKGEDVPYPTVRSGADLRKDRSRVLAGSSH
jgi:DNA-binding beta-propeller fold protein YncE